MKARIKATGKVIEAIPRYYNINGDPNLDRLYYLPEEVELIEDKEINWEQRTWEAYLAIAHGMASNSNPIAMRCEDVLHIARDLVAEYRKGE